MHVIIQGRESIFPNEASDLTIIGNCLRHSGISITVDAFVEKFSSTVRFLLKTINAANAESPTEMTPVIYSFGQAGSGKSTTMFGNREKRIPGLGKCLFPGVDAADLRFRAQEWLLLGSQKFRFRDIVSAQDPSVWKGSLISWDTLTWGEFNQFWPIMKKRLGEKSGVKFSFRGVLIMEIERKSTQKRAFFIDIPGFDREENAGQASSKSRAVDYVSKSFIVNMRKELTNLPIWQDIDAMLPHEKVEFLLTCIRSPYVEENINLTFEYLNQIKSLRTKRYQLRGLRRPISPAAQTAQQPDQAADRERSRVTLDDIMAELGGIKVTMGSDRTEFSNTVGQLSNTVGQLSNTVGQLSVSIGQLSATVAHLSIESIQTNAKLQTLQANFEKHLREEHRQPMAVTPPRISPPPQDSPIGAAPAIQLPEEDNRRSESARESTGTDQSSNSPRVSSQDDFPDVTFASSSASPEIEIPDSDESSSAAPASPAPRDSSESSANTRRSMYILRSRCNVSDDVVKKFPKDIQVGGSRPAVISSGSSSGDDDHDASKIRKMLSILKLNDPQQPRIIISSTLSFAVDDADLYANTNFAEYIAWVGKLTSKWQCTVCNKTFETYAIPAHVWLVHIRGSFKCEAEGCNFVGHSVSTMRGHLKRH